MAIKKATAPSAVDDGTEDTEETPDLPTVDLEFLDELPPPFRASSAGRSLSPETQALIEALKANPDKYAHVDVRKSGQPSRALRTQGVIETFRKREDGMYDRYAAYVGVENMPEPKTRNRKSDED